VTVHAELSFLKTLNTRRQNYVLAVEDKRYVDSIKGKPSPGAVAGVWRQLRLFCRSSDGHFTLAKTSRGNTTCFHEPEVDGLFGAIY
jgi:hypothetical protein